MPSPEFSAQPESQSVHGSPIESSANESRISPEARSAQQVRVKESEAVSREEESGILDKLVKQFTETPRIDGLQEGMETESFQDFKDFCANNSLNCDLTRGASETNISVKDPLASNVPTQTLQREGDSWVLGDLRWSNLKSALLDLRQISSALRFAAQREPGEKERGSHFSVDGGILYFNSNEPFGDLVAKQSILTDIVQPAARFVGGRIGDNRLMMSGVLQALTADPRLVIQYTSGEYEKMAGSTS